MTLLVDHQIRRLAERGMIEDFYDEPYQPGLSAGLTSCGYDARLSSEFYLIRGDMWGWIDPLRGVIDAEMENVSICDDDVCIINPGDFILGRTMETFSMPDNVAAVCWGKSTYARCGIHVNVTPLEPGWCGQVTLEIFNQAPRAVGLHPGRGICQFQFHHLAERPEITYADKGGKYQGQVGVTIARGNGDDQN
jgi:dCTP deaminase